MPHNRTAPPLRADDVTVEEKNQEIHIAIDTRRYRVRGLEKNQSGQQLRVNILATRDELVHMDTLDLCQARSRACFVKAAATELFVEEATVKRDVGRMLLALEQLQQERIEAATTAQEAKVELSEAERDEALELLRDPNLTGRILADYEACGLVGEETNKLVCYLACVSRHLNQPLAVLIQSGSAAGKTSLMDATLHFMPPEDQVRYSAMTGQSLYYMGRQDLKHKILAVAEEEGVAQASYALKLLQSDGRLRIAAAGKNSSTGRQETESYEIEGPVMMFLTTTAEQPDPELQNRCLTLHVDESPEQTEAIHARQRAAYTLDGQLAEDERQRIGRVHQNAQRLLEPLPVTIPWAERLRFRHDQTRMRRDHAKYLALIAAVTLLHQHQRPRKTRVVDDKEVAYLEATTEDAALANRLMSQVMGQSLDALLPQTRQLLALIDQYVRRRAKKEKKPRGTIRFTQRQLREQLGWGDFQLRRHLARLVELEYVLAHRTGYGNQRQYELLYEGQGRRGERFLLGLANIENLSTTPTQV
jgi:DNA primase